MLDFGKIWFFARDTLHPLFHVASKKRIYCWQQKGRKLFYKYSETTPDAVDMWTHTAKSTKSQEIDDLRDDATDELIALQRGLNKIQRKIDLLNEQVVRF